MENDHQNIIARLDAQDSKLEEIHVSIEKARKYFLLSFWITIVVFVLPLFGLIFIIPWFLNTLMGSYEGLL